MDRLPGATSLSRALLVLDRGRATGVLDVRSHGGHARLAVLGGTPRAMVVTPGDDTVLGDVLEGAGALDAAAHARALAVAPPVGPVGPWLVEGGACTKAALAHALRVQLRRRLLRVFRWQDPEYRFVAGDAELGVPLLPEPVPAADLVLAAMRDAVADVPLPRVRRALGTVPLHLLPLGESLLSNACLWPAEAAMLPLLRRGETPDVLLSAAGGSTRAMRGLYMLTLLRAVTASPQGAAAYPLLLRKHRQMQQATELDAFLDLPAGAPPAEARRALRRLAGKLHPDRFGRDAPPWVHRASTDVLSALVRAEAELRRRHVP